MFPMHLRSSRRLALPALVTAGALLGASGLPGVAPAYAAVPAAPADSALQIVLDSSGSMAAADPSGGTRIEAARRALSTVVDALPDKAVVGLRAYGGTFEDKTRGCTDTRVVTPLRALDREAVKTSFGGLKPAGYTPIAASLRAAVADLEGRRPARILLISDGEETCDGNPCEVARTLGEKGVELVVDTVGYAADAATRTQLQCIAEATGGQYAEAADGNALAAELTRSAARAFRDFSAKGTPVEGTPIPAGAPVLTPGQYTDKLADGQAKYYAVDLPPGVTPYISATLAVPRGDYGRSTYEGVTVQLTREKGSCERERQYTDIGIAVLPLPATVTTAPVADGPTEEVYGCGSPGRYTVILERDGQTDVAEIPVEILLLLEPPVSDAGTLPAQTVPLPASVPASAPAATGTTIAGGSGFADAPALQPGSYSDELRPRETSFYRVQVGWGQRLAVTAVASGVPLDRSDVYSSGQLEMNVFNPARQIVDVDPDSASSSASGTFKFVSNEQVQVHGFTAPVTWRNREATRPR